MDRDKAIRLVSKLLAKAEGTHSPHERASCLETARRLRLRHGITEAEIAALAEVHAPLLPMACYSAWRGALLETCGGLHGVAVKKPTSSVRDPIVLVGAASSVQRAIAAFDRWTRIVDEETRRNLGFRWDESVHGSWALGFVSRLMRELAFEAAAAPQPPRSAPTRPERAERPSTAEAHPEERAERGAPAGQPSEPEEQADADEELVITPAEFVRRQIGAVDPRLAQWGFRAAAPFRIRLDCPALPPGRSSRIVVREPFNPRGYMRGSAFSTSSTSTSW